MFLCVYARSVLREVLCAECLCAECLCAECFARSVLSGVFCAECFTGMESMQDFLDVDRRLNN